MPKKSKRNKNVESLREIFEDLDPAVQELLLSMRNDVITQVERCMKRRALSQAELARRMRTSRAVVHTILRRNYTSMRLDTLSALGVALGARISIKLPPVTVPAADGAGSRKAGRGARGSAELQ